MRGVRIFTRTIVEHRIANRSWLLDWMTNSTPRLIISHSHKPPSITNIVYSHWIIWYKLRGQCLDPCMGLWSVYRDCGFCHSPVDFRAHSRTYPHFLPLTPAPIALSRSLLHLSAPICTHSRSLPLTPACADARISMREWQKLRWLMVTQRYTLDVWFTELMMMAIYNCQQAIMNT